jgi:hypothetical protein
LAYTLDDDDEYPILPRIVTSALAEQGEAAKNNRDMDLTAIRVDDPRIAGISWHKDWREPTPMPGEHI